MPTASPNQLNESYGAGSILAQALKQESPQIPILVEINTNLQMLTKRLHDANDVMDGAVARAGLPTSPPAPPSANGKPTNDDQISSIFERLEILAAAVARTEGFTTSLLRLA